MTVRVQALRLLSLVSVQPQIAWFGREMPSN